MHPALSIVLFTTAAGAGFGLIIVLGLGAPLGYLPAGGWFAFVALAVATALVVAVARGGVRGSDVCADRDLRDRMGVFQRHQRDRGVVRDPRRGPGGGNHLLHRHDLPLAEAGPPMAQCLGGSGLFWARADERAAGSRPAAADLATAGARLDAGDRARGGGRLGDQGALLAGGRYDGGSEHAGQRHRARPARSGAAGGGAAHARQLPAQRDGISDRAQTWPPLALDRAAGGVCRAAGGLGHSGLGRPWPGDRGRGPGGGERGAGPCRRALAVFRRGAAHGDPLLRRRRGVNGSACRLRGRPRRARSSRSTAAGGALRYSLMAGMLRPAGGGFGRQKSAGAGFGGRLTGGGGWGYKRGPVAGVATGWPGGWLGWLRPRVC